MFAALSFWYHLPYSEIRRMPMSAIGLYMERLPKHQATVRLMIGESASVPHMEESARRDWAQDLQDLLKNDTQPAEPASPAALKMAGIGVQFVEKKVKHG